MAWAPACGTGGADAAEPGAGPRPAARTAAAPTLPFRRLSVCGSSRLLHSRPGRRGTSSCGFFGLLLGFAIFFLL